MELASGWIGTGWMTVDTSFVYFTACDVGSCEHPRLYRVPRDGGAKQELLTGDWVEAKLSVAGNSVQWGSHVIPTNGGQAAAMVGAGYPIAVAATTSAFYFADFYTGAIYRSAL